MITETLTTLVVTDTSRFNLGGPLRQLDMFGGRLGVIAGAGGLLFGLGAGAVNAAGRMEQLRIGFTTLLGSADAADRKLREMQQFAAKTPFALGDIAQASQQLLGAGLGADRLIPVQEALGNIISANGRSSEDFAGALLQVSQIISSGKLQGDELRILTERGLSIRGEMKALGVETGASAEEFLQALVKIGGSAKYAGAMERQSKTLFGSISNLADAGVRLGAVLGGPLIAPLTALTIGVTKLADGFAALPGPIQAVAAGALVFFAAKAAFATIQTMGLARAHLAAAAAARVHAAAETDAGRKVGGGGRFGGFGNIAGDIAGFAAFGGGEFAKQSAGGGMWGGIQADLGNVASRAGIGGLIGGRFGGAPGAGIGAVLGGIYGNLENTFDFGGGKRTAGDPLLEETKKTNDLLKGIDQKVGGGGGGTGDSSFFPAGIGAVVRAAR